MTQYYFDFVGGSDANNGLTIGSPKKTMGALAGLILTGNILSLKRGVVWPRDGFFGDVTLDILNKTPAAICTINDYGGAVDPPILDGLEYQTMAGTWAHTGSGRWTMAFANQVDRIMFGGSSSALSIGGLSYKGSSLTDATHQWWWSGGTLHIYTGSTTVSPPVFYGGIAIVSLNSGDVIRVRNSSNIDFQRIRTLGGQTAGWDFQCTVSDNANLNFTDCEALYTGINSGFRIRSISTTLKNRSFTFTRPIANMKTDTTEDEGSDSRWGGSDGFNITHSWNDINIIDPTATRFRHCGLNCYDEVGNLPGTLTVRAGAAYGYFDQSGIEYGRALNLMGASHRGHRREGLRDQATGRSTRSQFSGKVMVSGCTWKSFRYSTLPGYEVSHAVWFSSWDLGPGNSKMIDVTFQNNLIENPWSTPIVFAKGTNTAGFFDADKIKVYNNTVIDIAHYGNLGRKSFEALSLGFGVPAFQLVKNNNLISPSPGAQQVNWQGTLSTINGTTGFTGNVENVEGYVNRAAGDYHPTVNGGLTYAGVTASAFALDTDGIAFNNPPSIAPTEYAAVVNPTYANINNMLINGNWLIDQVNEGALYTVNAASVQGPDGWSGAAPASSGVFKVRRLADPDNAALKCLEITCTTIDASIAAADSYYVHTAIEGYDAAALMSGTSGAKQITIGFDFKSNVTGIYGISLANSALNRSYVGVITVPDANNHSYTVILTLDASGTWLYSNGVGLRLRICLAAGSNFQKAAGAWGADNMLTTSAQLNFMSNVANIAYLKRIHLVPGPTALNFVPQDYWADLAKCQRYYYRTQIQGSGDVPPAYTTVNARLS